RPDSRARHRARDAGKLEAAEADGHLSLELVACPPESQGLAGGPAGRLWDELDGIEPLVTHSPSLATDDLACQKRQLTKRILRIARVRIEPSVAEQVAPVGNVRGGMNKQTAQRIAARGVDAVR